MKQSFLNYLSDEDKSTLTKKQIIKKGLRFFVIFMIVAMVVTGGITYVLQHYNVKMAAETAIDIFSPPGTHVPFRWQLLYGVFIMIILTPIVEETIFRLWQSMRKWQVVFSVFVFMYALFSCIDNYEGINEIKDIHYYAFRVPLLAYHALNIWWKLLLAAVFTVPFAFIPQRIYISLKSRSYFKYIILFSILAFALLHIGNYNVTFALLPLYVLLCSRQFVGGVVMNYFRLNLGFWYGVLMHAVWNFIASLPAIYSYFRILSHHIPL